MFKDQLNVQIDALLFFLNENKNEKQKKKHRYHAFDNPIRIRESYFVIWMKTNRIRYRFYCFVAMSLCGGYQRVMSRYEWSEKLFRRKNMTPKGRSSLRKKRPNGTYIVASNESDNFVSCISHGVDNNYQWQADCHNRWSGKKNTFHVLYFDFPMFLISALLIFDSLWIFDSLGIEFHFTNSDLNFLFSLSFSFS